MRAGYTRVLFTVEDKLWKKLKRLKKELKLPSGAYSDAVNSALSTLSIVLDGAKGMRNKSDAEQRAEFYKIMARVVGDMANEQLRL